jgi:hypothetical protein
LVVKNFLERSCIDRPVYRPGRDAARTCTSKYATINQGESIANRTYPGTSCRYTFWIGIQRMEIGIERVGRETDSGEREWRMR